MRSLRILPALLLLLLLGGCVFPSGDELLAAPKPSSNYQSLQTELEKQLAQGVSYASPSEGENRSSIQLADLDNDGVEEAITFFRGATSATSNKFTVAVYRKQDDSYVCTGTIDGRGTALRSVEFPVLEPSGKRGMVLTWRLPGDGTGAPASAWHACISMTTAPCCRPVRRRPVRGQLRLSACSPAVCRTARPPCSLRKRWRMAPV